MTALIEQDEPDSTAIASSRASTTLSTEITLAERLESLKAGLLGALAAGLMFGVLTLGHRWLSFRVAPLEALSIGTTGWLVLISGAIAVISGFLFGVTYRYIIRQDQNPHLKDGAVLAFGLVRGLAIAEEHLHEPIALLPLVALEIESLVLFASVRLVLEKALAAGWLKPFGSLPTAIAPLVDPLPSDAYGTKSSNSD